MADNEWLRRKVAMFPQAAMADTKWFRAQAARCYELVREHEVAAQARRWWRRAEWREFHERAAADWRKCALDWERLADEIEAAQREASDDAD
jgi:hypothetical protein